MNCPSCGNSEIRPSQHSYWSDSLQRMIGRAPYRCKKCRLRFYSSEAPPSILLGSNRAVDANRSTHEINKSRRRRLLRSLIAIAIFAVMFLIFLILLNVLTADKGSQKDVGRNCGNAAERFVA
jgi:hypothetical protein